MAEINSLTNLTSPTGTESIPVQEAGGTLKRLLLSTISQFSHPIGSAYTQYYGLPTPATLFGGTWSLIYNTNAVCFMTEGSAGATYEAETFDGIVYDSQMQGHFHNIDGNQSTVAIAAGSAVVLNTVGATITPRAAGALTDGTNGTPRVGKATKPRRVIVRVWQRTA